MCTFILCCFLGAICKISQYFNRDYQCRYCKQIKACYDSSDCRYQPESRKSTTDCKGIQELNINFEQKALREKKSLCIHFYFPYYLYSTHFFKTKNALFLL